MVEKGHTYYQSRKLDRVPKEAVEELLGITLPDKQEWSCFCILVRSEIMAKDPIKKQKTALIIFEPTSDIIL